MSTAVWLAIFAAVCLWSAIAPADRLVWWLEASPALLAVAVLALTWRRFPLTPLSYWLILIHCVVLLVGAHYTYAQVPLFDWLREPLGWQRNNYDKLGHFAQGFVPAVIAREILIRLKVVPSARWRAFFIVSVCLAISAFYELLEWWAAVLGGESADAFLGTQGYDWDTQADMFTALVGAALALALLGRVHDRQLERLAAARPRPEDAWQTP